MEVSVVVTLRTQKGHLEASWCAGHSNPNWCVLNCVCSVLTSVKKKKKKDGNVGGVLESTMPSRAYRNCVITDEKCNIVSLKVSPSLSTH